ncbi:unnamed protein product [Ambrosiozyma monospora]|uniref:Unnamed protein product n=1 Tax=Ambrosiozyma monospora TaxID=43982 RepID=A0A9W6YU08_AMBMO|nr:unnamed protein product [Ambrosiozyma monospora]
MISLEETCNIYTHPSRISFSLGLLLALGIYISYVPQHSRIIRRRSSEGLSPLFLLLGSTSAFSAFINLYLVTLPARQCCSIDLTAFQCMNSQVGFIQVTLQMIGYLLVLFLCVFLTRNSVDESRTEYEKIYLSFQWFLAYAFVNFVLVIYLVFYQGEANAVMKFANLSGILATVFAMFQYFPQIYTTYRLKHPGSLSINMMLLQTPGGFVWSLSLFLQPGSKWSSWLPYISAAFLQLILLSMCLYYTWNTDTPGSEAEAITDIERTNIETGENQERQPLLA